MRYESSLNYNGKEQIFGKEKYKRCIINSQLCFKKRFLLSMLETDWKINDVLEYFRYMNIAKHKNHYSFLLISTIVFTE